MYRGEDLATYRSQTDVFFESPQEYLQKYFPTSVDLAFPKSPKPADVPGGYTMQRGQWKHEWPRYLVFFGSLLEYPGVALVLKERGYEAVWRGGRWWEGDDEKRKGGVMVYHISSKT